MIDEVVRENDIFLVQPCSVPVNDNLVELLLYLDAFPTRQRAQRQPGGPLLPLCPPGSHGSWP